MPPRQKKQAPKPKLSKYALRRAERRRKWRTAMEDSIVYLFCIAGALIRESLNLATKELDFGWFTWGRFGFSVAVSVYAMVKAESEGSIIGKLKNRRRRYGVALFIGFGINGAVDDIKGIIG